MLVLVWRTAYEPVSEPPSTASVADLWGEARIDWGAEGDVLIDASNPHAATAALGFVHGWSHPATMVLLRQAALGQMGEWFGEQALAADSLARVLGLATLAESSLQGLTIEDVAALSAYADGVAAAWAHRSIPLRQEFLLLRQIPEPWLPWHTLAVERLLYYLAADVACAPVPTFCKADRALRTLLHIHGFGGSLAWVVRDDTTTVLFQRHVYGSIAKPVFQEVTVQTGGVEDYSGASIVGTPFIVGGSNAHRSWAVLLGRDLEVAEELLAPVPRAHERIRDSQGREHLVAYARGAGRLQVAEAGDSTAWTLKWAGFNAGSDIGAWRALVSGRGPISFAVHGGVLLLMESGHSDWRVVGQPAIRLESAMGILLSRDPWAAHLTSPDSTWAEVLPWLSDLYSVYASRVLPVLLAAVDEQAVMRSSRAQSALIYLRNWDYRYERSSIGATLFAEWTQAYHSMTGDTLGITGFDERALIPALETAVRHLVTNHGPRDAEWRWGSVNPDRRHFVMARSKIGARMNSYAPRQWPGQGHGSTPRWGPTPTGASGLVPTASFEMWHVAPGGTTFGVRRRLGAKQGSSVWQPSARRDVAVVDTIPSLVIHTTILRR